MGVYEKLYKVTFFDCGPEQCEKTKFAQQHSPLSANALSFDSSSDSRLFIASSFADALRIWCDDFSDMKIVFWSFDSADWKLRNRLEIVRSIEFAIIYTYRTAIHRQCVWRCRRYCTFSMWRFSLIAIGCCLNEFRYKSCTVSIFKSCNKDERKFMNLWPWPDTQNPITLTLNFRNIVQQHIRLQFWRTDRCIFRCLGE